MRLGRQIEEGGPIKCMAVKAIKPIVGSGLATLWATPSTAASRARSNIISACHEIGRRASTASSVKRWELSGSRSILIVGTTHLPSSSQSGEIMRERRRNDKGTKKFFRGSEVLF